jgi:hypothetical protein
LWGGGVVDAGGGVVDAGGGGAVLVCALAVNAKADAAAISANIRIAFAVFIWFPPGNCSRVSMPCRSVPVACRQEIKPLTRHIVARKVLN